MLETSPAPEILSANAEKHSRRRKYLCADSICWVIYDRIFVKGDSGYPKNSPTELIKEHLWRVSNSLLDRSSDLCCICRCVDFEFYYSGFSSTKDLIISRVIPLGPVQDMDSDCSLCQLMIHSSKRTAGMAAFLCFVQRGKKPPHLNLSFYELTPGLTTAEETLTSGLTPAEENFHYDNPNYSASGSHEIIPFGGLISLIKIGDDAAWTIRRNIHANGRVVAPTVSFCLLKRFLEASDPVHSLNFWKRWLLLASNLTSSIPVLPQLSRPLSSAKKDSTTIISGSEYGALDDYNMRWELPARFRVIDVHQCCLVNPTPGIRFVALSYVWGKLTRPHLVNTKSSCFNLHLPKAISPLSEAIPRTIGDAMLATAGLGYRYLWVDALCIVQDDSEDIKDQMNRMAAIYRLASFTIVAAAGNDADAGLPGVGPTRRPQWQYVFGSGSARFANRGGDLEEFLNTSCWFTRGWTYQEFALSSRFLVFTTHQAFTIDAQHRDLLDSSYFFQCESDISRRTQRGGLADSFTGHITSKPLDAIGLYNNAVQIYSIRELTFQADIMNAFGGIGSYLNQGFRSGFTFGLPNNFLELALLWAVRGREETGFRKGFPEYSWASRYHGVSMWSRPCATWPSSRILWRNFSPQRKKDWFCEGDIMPQAGSEEARKWRFLPEGSVIKVVSGAKALSNTQPYWEDTEEHPSWQHARPTLPTRLLPSFQPAEPCTGYLHFWSHVIRLVLQPSFEDRLWTALSGQLNQQNDISSSARIGEFNMDSPAFPNPIDLILLCCFETHNRLPYFEPSPLPPHHHHEGERNLPWHASRFVRDAARANPRPQTVEFSPKRPNFTYAVLAVETIDGISYRRGIGTVDLSWFHKASPEARHIILG